MGIRQWVIIIVRPRSSVCVLVPWREWQSACCQPGSHTDCRSTSQHLNEGSSIYLWTPHLHHRQHTELTTILTVQLYASAVYAMAVCLSVCLLQVVDLLKRLNVGSYKQLRTIASGLPFSDTKYTGEIPKATSLDWTPNKHGVGKKFATFNK